MKKLETKEILVLLGIAVAALMLGLLFGSFSLGNRLKDLERRVAVVEAKNAPGITERLINLAIDQIDTKK